MENWAEEVDYCAFPVPAEITQYLATAVPILVMARVSDSALLQVSFFPVGGGQHYIRIKAKVRQETRICTGDRVRVQITVRDCKVVAVPGDLTNALRAARETEDLKLLSPGKQSFLIRRIEEAAKPETRDD